MLRRYSTGVRSTARTHSWAESPEHCWTGPSDGPNNNNNQNKTFPLLLFLYISSSQLAYLNKTPFHACGFLPPSLSPSLLISRVRAPDLTFCVCELFKSVLVGSGRQHFPRWCVSIGIDYPGSSSDGHAPPGAFREEEVVRESGPVELAGD